MADHEHEWLTKHDDEWCQVCNLTRAEAFDCDNGDCEVCNDIA